MSIYFAEAGGYIKIGYSAVPCKRAGSLTTNGTRPNDLPRGAEVDLIGWVPGDRWREGEVQARFIAKRVAGEWFRDIDREVICELIWSDPCGIDVYRMSAQAVFYAIRNPGVTRDEMTAAGVMVEALPEDEVLERASRMLAGGAA